MRIALPTRSLLRASQKGVGPHVSDHKAPVVHHADEFDDFAQVLATDFAKGLGRRVSVLLFTMVVSSSPRLRHRLIFEQNIASSALSPTDTNSSSYDKGGLFANVSSRGTGFLSPDWHPNAVIVSDKIPGLKTSVGKTLFVKRQTTTVSRALLKYRTIPNYCI